MSEILYTSEDREQEDVFRWANNSLGRYPELWLMYHVPNGGRRNGREAAKFKRMGVKPGVPDLCLPVARGPYHALYVEMKALNGRVSDAQKERMKRLAEAGNACCVCFGAPDAIRAIEDYLKL